MLGNVPEVSEGLQSLEHQLNLPTRTVNLRTSAVEPLERVVNTITYLAIRVFPAE